MSTNHPSPNGNKPDGFAVLRLSSLYDGQMRLRYLPVVVWHGLPDAGKLTLSLGEGRTFEAQNLLYLAEVGGDECEQYKQAIIVQLGNL